MDPAQNIRDVNKLSGLVEKINKSEVTGFDQLKSRNFFFFLTNNT